MADRVTTCPYCSNQCLSDVRQCPHCDVRFDNVRCARCYSLQPPGAFSCARCGHGLELEPLLDATDAPCPRCATPLEVAPGDDARVHECVRCGGMFVPRDALAEILTRAEVSGAMRGHAYAAWNAKHAAVTYVACPLCHASMNRVNFGRVSGIIVDVCKPHGTWFDAGELTRAVAFAASGGRDKTREREASERAREKKAVAAEHAKFVAFETKREAQDRLATWRDLLRSLFEW